MDVLQAFIFEYIFGAWNEWYSVTLRMSFECPMVVHVLYRFLIINPVWQLTLPADALIVLKFRFCNFFLQNICCYYLVLIRLINFCICTIFALFIRNEFELLESFDKQEEKVLNGLATRMRIVLSTRWISSRRNNTSVPWSGLATWTTLKVSAVLRILS